MKADCVFLDFGPGGTEFRKPIKRKLEVEGGTVTTTIRGDKCSFLVPSSYCEGGTLVYNVQYSQALDLTTGKPLDTSVQHLRMVLDSSMLRAMTESVAPRPYVSFRRLFGFLKRPVEVHVIKENGQAIRMPWDEYFVYFGAKVGRFLRRVGIPLDVEGRECLVVTTSDLEKVEKGEWG